MIESDLQVHRKHIQLGAQENRISKYFDEDFYTIDMGPAGSESSTECNGIVKNLEGQKAPDMRYFKDEK